MTPRKFFDAARSGWRESIASSCFNACEKLFASNSRNALLYISSSSDLVGATFSASKYPSPSAATAAIIHILIRYGLKLRSLLLTSRKLRRDAVIFSLIRKNCQPAHSTEPLQQPPNTN